MSVATPQSTPMSVVRDMRRARRTRRLGELEWFEVAYRAYLAALGGGVLIAWLSDLVVDDPASAEGLADVTHYGPAVLGIAVAAAIALGLRSGSDGGPISIEAPDVRFVLNAPVDRRSVLAGPVLQRLRAMAFGGAVVGGIAGQLAARRLPGSTLSWAASGAAAAASVGVLFVAVATVTHALRVPRAIATALAAAVFGWQLWAAWNAGIGPGNTIGSLALWGMRTRTIDLLGPAVVLVMAVLAVALCGRLSSEALVTRADLVSQLRFAATMQDLRTVVLLRRQLRGERARTRPWFRLPAARAQARGEPGGGREVLVTVVRRGLAGVARYPLSRLVRMAGLAITAGMCAIVTIAGTTPAALAMSLALFVLGLDAVEPLSQEVDRPDRTEAVPVERGVLFARHLVSSALVLVPFAALGAAVVTIWRPSTAGAVFAVALPVMWMGAFGAVVSTVRDAPDPLAQTVGSNTMPPEFAGMTTALQMLIPLVVSAFAAGAALLLRYDPSAGAVARVWVLAVLVLSAGVVWVQRRDAWRAAWRKMLEGARR